MLAQVARDLVHEIVRRKRSSASDPGRAGYPDEFVIKPYPESNKVLRNEPIRVGLPVTTLLPRQGRFDVEPEMARFFCERLGLAKIPSAAVTQIGPVSPRSSLLK